MKEIVESLTLNMLMKVLSHPGAGTAKFCIIVNWTGSDVSCLIQEASSLLTNWFKLCVGVSLQSEGVSLQNEGVSLQNEGVSLHCVGVCLQSEGVSLQNEGVSLHCVGVSLQSNRVSLQN